MRVNFSEISENNQESAIGQNILRDYAIKMSKHILEEKELAFKSSIQYYFGRQLSLEELQRCARSTNIVVRQEMGRENYIQEDCYYNNILLFRAEFNYKGITITYFNNIDET